VKQCKQTSSHQSIPLSTSTHTHTPPTTQDALGRAQPLPLAQSTAAVDAAIQTRRSIRAFLNTPVPQATLEAILNTAQRAPSGTNTQAWKTYVVTGAKRDAISRDVCAAFDDPAQQGQHTEGYSYYPTQWISPFVDRRRKVGWDLYGLLGIGKADKQRMHVQHRRNYEFFDAPVGLFFTIDRIMQTGGWIDAGMYMQNVMVAARGRGLDTCPQAAWVTYHELVRKHLGCGEQEILVCGMSLGHADPSAIENTLHTDREPLANVVRFLSEA
jgi:nitroreductase